MSLHESLLQALQSVASVELLSSLRDERLMFERATDLRVFIPDLHLLSDKARQRYRYGTNQVELLAQVLGALQQLKKTETARGNSVTAYQLGDCLDLWREDPRENSSLDVPSQITDSHREVMSRLYSDELRTRFLLGNHDADLYRWPNYSAWARNYFLTQSDQSGYRGVVLHGDIFDWIEQFPEQFNRWAVYFMSPYKNADAFKVSELIDMVRKENASRDFSLKIAGSAAIGQTQPAEPSAPKQFNVTTNHPFLTSAYQSCQRVNKEHQLKMRFAVIGHTHMAKISVHDAGQDDFFALIDTGAWIEDSILPTQAAFPNAQVTAMSENEVRIYQLRPRAGAI